MSLIYERPVSRRGFLKTGGALVVMAASIPAALRLDVAEAIAAGVAYPALDPTQLSTWITVHADGTVTARSGHVDLGQGNRTALAQIIAEELDVAFSKVTMILGNTNATPNQGVTAGSTTIRLAGAQLRLIAAEARASLLTLASAKLATPVSGLTVSNGVVTAGTKTASYGSLVEGQILTAATPIEIKGYGGFGMQVSVTAKPKSPTQYTTVGQSIPRVDIPDKVTTAATYVQDVKVPGMLHARVIHPQGIGSTVTSVGTLSGSAAQVVQIGNLVAVLAEREWDAIKGASTLSVKWSSWNGLPLSSNMAAALRAATAPIKSVTDRGSFQSSYDASAKKVSATYQTPFENHGMLGPSCAVADVRSDGTATVYSSTQYPQGLQAQVATMLGTSPQQVEVLWFEGPGCYGRLSAVYDDAASEAVLLSKKVGRPVRVQWMRQDENIWEPHGPGTLHDMSGGLDASGNPVAWKHEAWMPPNNDSTALGPALAGLKMAGRAAIGGWTGPNLYTFANALELAHALPELGAATSPYGFGLRTTFLRSPGQYQITFAQEAFVDEMAAAAKQDPLQFRLQHLTDPRAIAVLKAAASAAGWEARTSPRPAASPTQNGASGQGIALVLRDGTYAASVVKLALDPSTGKIQLQSVTVAQDSGLIINPMAIKHQIESCVIQTASRAIHEEVTFDTSNVTSTDWASYPLLTMAEAPQVINSVLINHPEIPSTGVGEPAVNLMAPAISSAIFDATGVRLRTLPFTPTVVKAGLTAGA
ncbi:MAG TPA: molybdopterin cofactor-binding domain-containing protein [Candidatus Nitrosotalea sp.]|nr:molybdopterin cofactor-binding domain-containing protein [Candidatus Nitrosotalea sp.]